MVLEVLWERPAHPYQVISILKERRVDAAARLNFGALYGVVAGLERDGLIEAVEVTREGNRPPRTVYRTTPAGGRELGDWVGRLVATPAKEYPAFQAALAVLAVLPPDRAGELLGARARALAERIAELDRDAARSAEAGLPELLRLEAVYERALVQADLDFTRGLAGGIGDGSLGGVVAWRALRLDDDGRPDPAHIAAAFGAPTAGEGASGGEE
jgi:DNA-binding PadR family transcriptional regulator